MNKKLQRFKYIFWDFLMAATAWAMFFVYRKTYIEPFSYGYQVPIELDKNFYLGLLILPALWVSLYGITGYYTNILRRSRLTDLGETLKTSIFGILIIFFVLILDDTVGTYKNYYKMIGVLFGLHFTLTYIPRLVLTTITNHKIHRGKIGFNTLLIGSNGKAQEVIDEIKSQKKSTGNRLVGFVNVLNNDLKELKKQLPHLGNSTEIIKIVHECQIEEVIIALDFKEEEKVGRILNQLEGCNVAIKAIPSMYDILTGKVRMSTIFGTPLIMVSHNLMPYWQEQLKQFIDIVVSLLALIISLPITLVLSVVIKLTSKGPVFYTHERIGKYGKPFKIIKFRSMYCDAEKQGPQLSSEKDPRVTRVGRFMRKMRLDEIPNFINVLKGEMSLVGPRPERQYYIDQIMEIAPHYIHLQKVKPGITSWGQVKFGYASNVKEMVKRLKYDILYIENMSLYVDLKILIYTILTIIRREGK
jgi:exopolysaccharide biosynthesis polyprenyl glycosylphosphotransferase